MPDAAAALRLSSPPGAPVAFTVEIEGGAPHAEHRRLTVSADAKTCAYVLANTGHDAWLDFEAALARDFGTDLPLNRRPAPPPSFQAPLKPLLTEPLSPGILYGYGDPAVLKTPEGYVLVVTSNDAPDAFPILTSPDLQQWSFHGFVFPEGQTPPWAATGRDVGDFWAPEMHRVGEEYWVCFAARAHSRELAIGLAKSRSPTGPFRAPDAPLVGGGMIDAHIVKDSAGAPLLIWKSDANGVWPRRLVALLSRRPALIAPLFPDAAGRRTAAFAATLWPWLETLEPMEQFFALQTLVEAAADRFTSFCARVAAELGDCPPDVRRELEAVLEATKTHIWAQRLSPEGDRLIGPRTSILVNDLDWEAHLIEGPWISRMGGRYWLFYAGNDFSTDRYGIGAAVADHPLGPYVKMAEPLLRSTPEWRGPGHPSVTTAPDGSTVMLLHAFFPGHMGYKAFRALLSTRLELEAGCICVR